MYSVSSSSGCFCFCPVPRWVTNKNAPAAAASRTAAIITIKTIRPAPDLLLDLLLRLLMFRSFLMTGIISSLPFIIAHVKGKVNMRYI